MTYLFVVDTPTPQRAPTFDSLGATLRGARFYYLSIGDDDRGWGRVHTTHAFAVLDSWRSRARFVRDLCDPRLEVVCLFGYRHWSRKLACLVARVRSTPVVVRSDSSQADHAARPAPLRLLKHVYLRSLFGQPEVWTVGQRNDEYWRSLGFDRRVRIPYTVPVPPGGAELALEVSKRSPARAATTVFAFVGRLTVDKGVTDLLRAFQRLKSAPSATGSILIVAGQGPLAADVAAQADSDLVYLGAVPYHRLGSVYAAADVVVVPSRREPWGLVVNEALLHGARVLASDRVAAADDLVNGERGARFPAGDVTALTAALVAETERTDRQRVVYSEVDVAQMMAERLRALSTNRQS